MLKVSVATAVAVFAGSAVAGPVLGDHSTYRQISAENISMISLDEGTQGAVSSIYSNMDSGTGFVAFPAGNGVLGADDYVSTASGSATLESLRFVGGSEQVGGVLAFDFFNAAGDTFIDGFTVALPSAGNFIWTITLGGVVTVDAAGILQISTDATSTGQWFLADAGPTVGSEDVNAFGGGDGVNSHNFELNVIPTPGALSLLGMGGLLAARRRR